MASVRLAISIAMAGVTAGATVGAEVSSVVTSFWRTTAPIAMTKSSSSRGLTIRSNADRVSITSRWG
jgi:hypothetical protein